MSSTKSASLRYVHAGEVIDIWPPLFLRHYSNTKECLGSSVCAEPFDMTRTMPKQSRQLRPNNFWLKRAHANSCRHCRNCLVGGAWKWAGVTARAALNPPVLLSPASRCRTLRLLRCSVQLSSPSMIHEVQGTRIDQWRRMGVGKEWRLGPYNKWPSSGMLKVGHFWHAELSSRDSGNFKGACHETEHGPTALDIQLLGSAGDVLARRPMAPQRLDADVPGSCIWGCLSVLGVPVILAHTLSHK